MHTYIYGENEIQIQCTTSIFQKGASGVKREKPPVPIAERPPWNDRL